ncbi:MAG: MBL fold metallo-hydrolase [Lachnospiraceae bacterium]|jgi:L-ascorbate 6-phosphate lactonase|nr:MBL fold metallo-hydrolase [Lachnospiraceae bacterium]
MNEFETRLLFPDEKTSLNYVVQAGFVLKSKKGTTLGVDLYLTDCVERFDHFKRLSPKVMDPSTKLDFVVCSHWHLDHFDIDAMPLLMSNGKTRLVCCEDCKDHVKNLNLDESRVTYVSVGDTVKCNDITVHAVFCDHGTGAPLAVGFVFEVDGYKVYLAGDTALRLDKAPEVAKYGPFDVMMAPINGAFGNLNEPENVELCKYHRPKLSIPCHFWTFGEQHGDPGVWAELMKKDLPDQRYIVLAAGEQLILDEI